MVAKTLTLAKTGRVVSIELKLMRPYLGLLLGSIRFVELILGVVGVLAEPGEEDAEELPVLILATLDWAKFNELCQDLKVPFPSELLEPATPTFGRVTLLNTKKYVLLSAQIISV